MPPVAMGEGLRIGKDETRFCQQGRRLVAFDPPGLAEWLRTGFRVGHRSEWQDMPRGSRLPPRGWAIRCRDAAAGSRTRGGLASRPASTLCSSSTPSMPRCLRMGPPRAPRSSRFLQRRDPAVSGTARCPWRQGGVPRVLDRVCSYGSLFVRCGRCPRSFETMAQSACSSTWLRPCSRNRESAWRCSRRVIAGRCHGDSVESRTFPNEPAGQPPGAVPWRSSAHDRLRSRCGTRGAGAPAGSR